MYLPVTARRSAFLAIFAVIGIVCVAYGATANPQDWTAITVGLAAFVAFAILLVVVLVVGERWASLDESADRIRKEADETDAFIRKKYRGRKASVVFDPLVYRDYQMQEEARALGEQ